MKKNDSIVTAEAENVIKVIDLRGEMTHRDRIVKKRRNMESGK